MFASRLALRTTVRRSSFATSKRMSSYNVNLNIDTPTLKQLRGQGYTLYAFKGVKPSSKATLSTVWFSMEDYMEDNVITWSEEYQGYITLSNVDNGAYIDTWTKRTMEAGNFATVDATGGGILTVSTDSSNAAADPIQRMTYNFYNPSKTIYTCGLSHKNPDGSVKPICATPLNPGNAVPIVPLQKVYFFFSTAQMDLGQAFSQATSDGFLLDLTLNSSMNISYNMANTWSAGGSASASRQKAQPFFDLWGR